MSRVLLVLAAFVILCVCVSESTVHYPYPYPDPKDKVCEVKGGHCHPSGDSCGSFFERKIGYCYNNGPCCKCDPSNSCENYHGHCHYHRPCGDFYETTIKACGCEYGNQHGICCKCTNYRCGNLGGTCRKYCSKSEVVLTRSCGCYKGTKCCKPIKPPQYSEYHPYDYQKG